jgi:hypothetical protein
MGLVLYRDLIKQASDLTGKPRESEPIKRPFDLKAK